VVWSSSRLSLMCEALTVVIKACGGGGCRHQRVMSSVRWWVLQACVLGRNKRHSACVVVVVVAVVAIDELVIVHTK